LDSTLCVLFWNAYTFLISFEDTTREGSLETDE
jgi:hypothetical protein